MSEDVVQILAQRRALVLSRLHGVPVAEPEAEALDRVAADERHTSHLADRARQLDQLRAIDAAVARVRAGEYGLCVDCGDPIKPARLEAIPEVATCVRCQETRERAAQDRGGAWAPDEEDC